jgi:hypothetical protein
VLIRRALALAHALAEVALVHQAHGTPWLRSLRKAARGSSVAVV